MGEDSKRRSFLRLVKVNQKVNQVISQSQWRIPWLNPPVEVKTDPNVEYGDMGVQFHSLNSSVSRGMIKAANYEVMPILISI